MPKPEPLLREDLILVPLPAATLAQALTVMIQRIEEVGLLRDPEALRKGIELSPERAAVPISPAVILPHYRTDSVERLVVALGISAEPLRTEQPDARVVALVLAPPDDTSTYLRAVSALARAFRHDDVIARLFAATSARDVLDIPELGELAIQPKVAVADILDRDAPAAHPDMSMRAAVDLMLHHGARALPVVGDKGEVLGIVSEWDVLRGMRMSGPRERNGEDHGLMAPLAVRDVMTRSVMCIAESTGLEEAANLMIKKEVEQFPVVRDGRFTGLVTRGDILRKLYGR
jgi:CBS domain-containing protein/mannitol/fructose-specific phosphotransferase system IIA component (Ntr-type)